MNKKKSSIIAQVAKLFIIGTIVTGILTYFSQRELSDASVRKQTETVAGHIADEVSIAVREYPANEWLVPYWKEHSRTLDIVYDANYTSVERLRAKCQVFEKRHPDLVIQYVTEAELMKLPEEDQKLYAEIAYSLLICRINEIKAAYHVDYLFCVATDDTYKSQFFLFSAADPGDVRGTNYEEVYPLGAVVTVNKSQSDAMYNARKSSANLADAGDYVDYYAMYDLIGDDIYLIGLTYNLSSLKADIRAQTIYRTVSAVVLQMILALMTLLLIFLFVLRPLKEVQRIIRMYKETKDSRQVKNSLNVISSTNEIGQVADDFGSLAEEMDDYMARISSITAEKERMSTELALAARIQADVLPGVFPPFPDRNEFDIFALMNPAREVGGDFYDFFLIDDDHLYMAIADVSGKGIPAALFMMSSRNILANNAMAGKSPAEILADTNRIICSSNREEMFVTAWIGILEISTGRLTAANAGHEYPVLKRNPDSPFEIIQDRHGFVMGGISEVKYTEYEMQLEKGSRLFIYTDGVPEAMNTKKELFGTKRMLEALNMEKNANPKSLLENIQRAVDTYADGTVQFDDVTMLCLEYRGEDAGKEIAVDAEPANLPKVTDFINEQLEQMGCSMKKQMQIDVAVDEVFTNIASYAYTPEKGKAWVRIEKQENPAAAVLTFADTGVPYDPTGREEPDLTLSAEEREIGGLGIVLVRKMMDEISYEYRDGKNVLTLKKYL